MKVKRSVSYTIDHEEHGEFEVTHEPVEDSVMVKARPGGGFEVRYLAQDLCAESPVENSDDADRGALFLVHFSRDCHIANDKHFTQDDARAFYTGEYGEDGEGEPLKEHVKAERFHMFPVAAYIHSGVVLKLGNGRGFPNYQWDVSHVGVACVAKSVQADPQKARELAEGLVEEWNAYLNSDVYGIVSERFDEDHEPIDDDSCWGFYGRKWAEEALLTEIGEPWSS